MNNGKVKIIRWNGRKILDQIDRINDELAKTKIGTPEYDALSAELAKWMDILKKYKDSRHNIKPEAVATLIVIGGLALIAICLETENPKIMKVVPPILKLFKVPV